ncbi:MAG TPA: efflux RND transporter periplasmic adaptor subunit [Candidatus Binatia bacterium]|nr:efflux RND transporter periplasmic adaptor subunit [Candidatus Binatia bacterium]
MKSRIPPGSASPAPAARFGAALLIAMAAAGCGHRDEPGRAAADTTPPVEVTVRRVGTAGSERELILPARVAAREEVTIRATIGARLSALPYQEGAAFPAGVVLARFDATEAKAALQAARSGLAAASSRLDLARKQEARVESLYADRVAALRELELARQDRQAAEAAYAAANATQAGLVSGTEVRAPFAGVVVRHHVDPGTSLNPGDAVLDVRSTGAGEIVAAVPEGWSADLRSTRATVRFQAGPWHPASLLRVDGMTDYASRTRTARFKLSDRAVALVPGDFAEVRLEAPQAPAPAATGAPAGGRRPGGVGTPASGGALSVPSSAVIRRGSLTGVYVVQEGRAWLRWVRLGREDASSAEVLAGLEPGDDIALDPSKLADGRAVTERR